MKEVIFLRLSTIVFLKKKISNVKFIQDNESRSKGVLRGLHFQKPPFDQSKLVRCSFGEILDVAVDLEVILHLLENIYQ